MKSFPKVLEHRCLKGTMDKSLVMIVEWNTCVFMQVRGENYKLVEESKVPWGDMA